MSYVDDILARVKTQNPNEPEFNQAVYEVLESLRPVIEKNEDIEPVLKKALEISKTKPCMIEVKIDRDINVLPMIPAGKPVVNPITEIDLEA